MNTHSIFDVKTFGAKGDGTVNDTANLQAAIDACHRVGGGMVLVPSGVYLSGSLQLRSRVNMHLTPGAVILGRSDDCGYSVGALLWADGGERITLSGSGTIDGQGSAYFESDNQRDAWPLAVTRPVRPKLCAFTGCKDLNVEGVTLQAAAHWCLHMQGCRRVRVSGVVIRNGSRAPNADGIDPDCCRDVRISDCHIESPDDCIVLKTTKEGAEKYGHTENVVVSNCTLISRSCALKVGTETFADIRNCRFHNCTVTESNRAIGVWVRDGATVENISFGNIAVSTRRFDASPGGRSWWGQGEAVFISAAKRLQSRPAGRIKNVSVHDVYGDTEGGVLISGSPDSRLEAIRLHHLGLEMTRRSKSQEIWTDLRPSRIAPGLASSRELHAITCRYADDVDIDHVAVTWNQPTRVGASHALFTEHVSQLRLSAVRGNAARKDLEPIALHHTKIETS